MAGGEADANATVYEVYEDDSVRICWKGGSGLVLPLGGEAERLWPARLKVVLYGIGLMYCFLGVSIVADRFMSAIERITSKQRRVRIPGTTRHVTKQVWNETVANLTLMALGSSAPEILLALNDIIKNEFYEGRLGPSTIVGSAAFNLFVIVAVCVNSVPDGEVRVIKEMGVFVVTALFSLFAYAWLLYIVQFNTRDVIEVWEGTVTFAFFPVLVFVSYATDVGWLTLENCRKFLWFCLGHGWEGGLGKDEEAGVEDGDRASCASCGASLLSSCWAALRGLARRCFACLVSCCCCCCLLVRSWRNPEEAEDGEAQSVLERQSSIAVATVAGMEAVDVDAPLLDAAGQPIDHEAGIITFAQDTLAVSGTRESSKVVVPVYRKNGARGRVSCAYRFISLTAVAGYDYEDDEGELNFRDGVTEASIELTILPKEIGERSDRFLVALEDKTGTLMFNPYLDGGREKSLLTVFISNNNSRGTGVRAKLTRLLDGWFNIDEVRQGNAAYREQIVEALFVNGSREDQETASIADWIVHFIWFIWKVLFSLLCPPPTYLGGWVCFWASLVHIAWLTIVIGDMAELLGCVIDIDDAITAITVVALGTSVPDLFASRAAAKQDEWADASIVNVTGSNSVNVFLGIGVPWMLASIYWSVVQSPEVLSDWRMKYAFQYGDEPKFIVRSGHLAFSVAVFALAAVVCLVLIQVRRQIYGGELGGPSDPKAYTSFLLFLLWVCYIALSIWKYISKTEDLGKQAMAIGIAVPVVITCMILFALFLKALKISKKYIGEEGFWGIFVAACVVGGRMLVFMVFEYQP